MSSISCILNPPFQGIVCRFLVPEAASPDAGLPAGGSSVAVEEQTGAAAAVSMAAPAAVSGRAGPQPEGMPAAKQQRLVHEAPCEQLQARQQQQQRTPSKQQQQLQQRRQQPGATGAAARGAASEPAVAGSNEGSSGKRGRKKQLDAQVLRSCSSTELSPSRPMPRSAQQGSRASSAASTASAAPAQPQPSDLPANRGSKAHGGKAVAGSKAQPAAQPSVQPATEDAVAGGAIESGRHSRSRSRNRRGGQDALPAQRVPEPSPQAAEQPTEAVSGSMLASVPERSVNASNDAAPSVAGSAQQRPRPVGRMQAPPRSRQTAGPAGGGRRGQHSQQAASREAAVPAVVQAKAATAAMPAAGSGVPLCSTQLTEAEVLAANLLGLAPAPPVCGYCSPAAAAINGSGAAGSSPAGEGRPAPAAVCQGAAGLAELAAVPGWQGPAGSADLSELAAAPAGGQAGVSGRAEGERAVGSLAGTPAATPVASPLRLSSPASGDAGSSSSDSCPGSPAGGSNGSGSSYLSYCSSEGFRTPSRPSNYGLPYAFGPANQLPWHDAVGE